MNTVGTGDADRALASLRGLALGDAFGETWFGVPAEDAEGRIAGREPLPGPWVTG